jgi:hypothetical protein
LNVQAAMEIGALTLRNLLSNPTTTGLTLSTGNTLTVDGLFTWSGQAILGGGTVDAKGDRRERIQWDDRD